MPIYIFSVMSDDEKERGESSSHYGFSAEYEIEAKDPEEAMAKGRIQFNSEHPDKNLDDYATDVAWSS